jgi:hypothetical protein
MLLHSEKIVFSFLNSPGELFEFLIERYVETFMYLLCTKPNNYNHKTCSCDGKKLGTGDI